MQVPKLSSGSSSLLMGWVHFCPECRIPGDSWHEDSASPYTAAEFNSNEDGRNFRGTS